MILLFEIKQDIICLFLCFWRSSTMRIIIGCIINIWWTLAFEIKQKYSICRNTVNRGPVSFSTHFLLSCLFQSLVLLFWMKIDIFSRGTKQSRVVRSLSFSWASQNILSSSCTTVPGLLTIYTVTVLRNLSMILIIRSGFPAHTPMLFLSPLILHWFLLLDSSYTQATRKTWLWKTNHLHYRMPHTILCVFVVTEHLCWQWWHELIA